MSIIGMTFSALLLRSVCVCRLLVNASSHVGLTVPFTAVTGR